MQTQSAMNTPYNSEEAQQKTNPTQVVHSCATQPRGWFLRQRWAMALTTANCRRMICGPNIEMKPGFCLEKHTQSARSINQKSVLGSVSQTQPIHKLGTMSKDSPRTSLLHTGDRQTGMLVHSWQQVQKDGEGGRNERKTPHRTDEGQNRKANTG